MSTAKRQRSSVAAAAQLSDDILRVIWSFVSLRQIARMRQVGKHWRELIDGRRLPHPPPAILWDRVEAVHERPFLLHQRPQTVLVSSYEKAGQTSILRAIKALAPTLQSIQFHFRRWPCDSFVLQCARLVCHRMQRLVLEGAGFNSTEELVAMNWPQLKHLGLLHGSVGSYALRQFTKPLEMGTSQLLCRIETLALRIQDACWLDDDYLSNLEHFLRCAFALQQLEVIGTFDREPKWAVLANATNLQRLVVRGSGEECTDPMILRLLPLTQLQELLVINVSYATRHWMAGNYDYLTSRFAMLKRVELRDNLRKGVTVPR